MPLVVTVRYMYVLTCKVCLLKSIYVGNATCAYFALNSKKLTAKHFALNSKNNSIAVCIRTTGI